MTKPIRLEARLRNNVLWHCIFDRYRSVSQFVEANPEVGNQVAIGKLLNLKRKARNKDGAYCVVAARLCGHFKMLKEDLFPDELYGFKETRAVLEIPFSQIEAPRERLRLPETEIAASRGQVGEELMAVLDTLPPREAEIIKLRFGLEGEQKTLDEIGQIYNVTGNRIRQLESKGLGRLRRARGATEISLANMRDIQNE